MLIGVCPLLVQDPTHHVADQSLHLGEDVVPGSGRGRHLGGQQGQGGVSVGVTQLAQHVGHTVNHIVLGPHLHQAIRLLACPTSHILDHLLGIRQSLQLLLSPTDAQLVVRRRLHAILLKLTESALIRIRILVGHGQIAVSGGQGLAVAGQALPSVAELLVLGLQLVCEGLLQHLEVELRLSLRLACVSPLFLRLAQKIIKSLQDALNPIVLGLLLHQRRGRVLVRRSRCSLLGLQELLNLRGICAAHRGTIQQDGDGGHQVAGRGTIDLGQPSGHLLLDFLQGPLQRVNSVHQLLIPGLEFLVLRVPHGGSLLEILLVAGDGTGELLDVGFRGGDTGLQLRNPGLKILLSVCGVLQLVLLLLGVVLAPLNELVILSSFSVTLCDNLGGQTSKQLDHLLHRAALVGRSQSTSREARQSDAHVHPATEVCTTVRRCLKAEALS
mmetsp:Transcript_41148/g.92944  ORF Transcript_41148/g.92944 Transcript_41148/m.92944 type:complete len:442 (-) Transcript_41148:3-1328(-)